MRFQVPECHRAVFTLTKKPTMNRTGIKLFTVYLLRDTYHAVSISSIDCSNVPLLLLLFLLVVYLVVLKRPNITGFLLSRVCSRNTSSVKFKCSVIGSKLLFLSPKRETSLLVKSVILCYSCMLLNFMQFLKAIFEHHATCKGVIDDSQFHIYRTSYTLETKH